MARARNIKPAFFQNEELIELGFADRLLFIGLWTLADREGRLADRPKRIKMQIFPADHVDVAAGLDALASRQFIRRYQVGEESFIQIVNFAKHQSPHHRELPSEIPAEGASPSPAPAMPADEGKHDEPLTGKPGPTPGQPEASRADTGYLNPDTPFRNPSTTDARRPNSPETEAGPVRVPAPRVVAKTPTPPGSAAPPAPPAEPPFRADQPFDLLEALCDEVGADASVLTTDQKHKQLGVAKRLVSTGMTAADVRAETRWLLGQDWVTSGVDLFLLEKQRGKWQLQGKPTAATAKPRGRSAATEQVFDEALNRTRGHPPGKQPRYDNVFDVT